MPTNAYSICNTEKEYAEENGGIFDAVRKWAQNSAHNSKAVSLAAAAAAEAGLGHHQSLQFGAALDEYIAAA